MRSTPTEMRSMSENESCVSLKLEMQFGSDLKNTPNTVTAIP